MLLRSTLTKQLNEIINVKCSRDEKLLRLLQLGCENFDLVLGLISKIKGPSYMVLASYPEGLINNGDIFNLRETICDITKLSDGVTSFAKASGTNWASHPAYDKFSIEAYIGIPYFLEGKLAGTLNFSSPSARAHSFTFKDDDDIDQLAKTLEKILVMPV